jgi:VanZ family protein
MKAAWPVRILCALILCVILTAGLWPFLPPRNDAAWAGDRNGIRFGGHGVIFGPGPQSLAGPPAAGPCALEIWLQPARTNRTGTIIAFHSPTAPTEFSLFQEGSSMGFRLHNEKNPSGPHFYERLGEVFGSGEPVFLTIASSSNATSVYVNGALAKTMPDFPLVLRNLQGQIIAGTHNADDGWAGQLLGIAAYERALTPAEAALHYETWTQKGRPESLTATGNVWLYLFDEHRGTVAHEALGSGADLNMPERYTAIHPHYLDASRPHRRDWSDILLNIAGFAPFGFFFCAAFRSPRASALTAVIVILLGMTISLGIEVRQAYLPGRTSSLTDLVTNTLGAALGVCLFQIRWVRTVAAKAGLPGV